MTFHVSDLIIYSFKTYLVLILLSVHHGREYLQQASSLQWVYLEKGLKVV